MVNLQYCFNLQVAGQSEACMFERYWIKIKFLHHSINQAADEEVGVEGQKKWFDSTRMKRTAAEEMMPTFPRFRVHPTFIDLDGIGESVSTKKIIAVLSNILTHSKKN